MYILEITNDLTSNQLEKLKKELKGRAEVYSAVNALSGKLVIIIETSYEITNGLAFQFGVIVGAIKVLDI